MRWNDYLVSVGVGFAAAVVVLVLLCVVLAGLREAGIISVVGPIRWPLWVALAAWVLVTALIILLEHDLIGVRS